MRDMRLRLLGLILVSHNVLISCSSTVTGPTGMKDLAGQWSGATASGTPIEFVVSSAERVTSVTFSYRQGNCSGTESFTGLAVDIMLPPASSMLRSRLFVYGARTATGAATFSGEFISTRAASGAFTVVSDCGTVVDLWSAQRH